MTKLTKIIEEAFLKLTADGVPMIRVCRFIGVSRTAVYNLAERKPKFKKAWEEAKEDGNLSKLADLEEAADKRAMEGYLNPVYYKGKRCGAKRHFSDSVLIARLKAQAKRAGDDSYIDRIDQTSNGETVQAGLVVVTKAAQDEDEWHADHSKG